MAIAKRLVRYLAQRPASRLSGRGGGSSTPAPTLTFLQGAVDAANGTEYTFSAQSLGDAADDRLIVVCVHGRATGALAVSSVSVGGVTANEVVTQTNGVTAFSRAAIYVAAVPSGTTGDVVVTFAQESLRCGVQIYRMTGVSATASDTDSSTASPPASTLTVPAGGLVIACSNSATAAPNSCTWLGVTEDADEQIAAEGLFISSGSSVQPSAQNLEVSATWATDFQSIGLFALWGP